MGTPTEASRPRIEPWRGLGPDVADAIEPVLPELTSELLATIGREVPEYARPLEGEFGRGLRVGITEALRQFLELIRDPDGGRGRGREIYVGLGRGEFRQGRSLDSLLSAYRTGARIAWRRIAEAGRRADLDTETMHLLAESIFAYIDELSAESAEGFAEEQSAREGARERERRQLLKLLCGEDADPDEIERAAAAAGWEIPKTAAAVACRAEDLPRIMRGLSPGCVGSVVGGHGCIALADPDGPGRLDQLADAVVGRPAAIGPTGSATTFRSSWSTAQSALRNLEPEGLLVTERSLFELILAENRGRLRRIGDRRLAPLEELTPKSRERLLATLAAELRCGGDVSQMADELVIHPQSVRYRRRRLRELLGEQLDDPGARLELHAALKAGCLGTPETAEDGRG